MAKKEALTEFISFRVGEEALKEIQRQAAPAGLTPNEWCRRQLLKGLAEGKKVQTQTRQTAPPPLPSAAPTPAAPAPPNQVERVILEEVFRLRFLIRQIVLRHMEGQLNSFGWAKIEQFTDSGFFEEVADDWYKRYGMKPPQRR